MGLNKKELEVDIIGEFVLNYYNDKINAEVKIVDFASKEVKKEAKNDDFEVENVKIEAKKVNKREILFEDFDW